MTLIYFILILGITVFIHEFGHFIFAKKFGVHVYEFSIGMGPRIFKFNRKNDETDYCLRLFPIGGFVQMAGEEVEADENILEDKRLNNKPAYQRFIIMVAGVTMNFILAIVLLFILGLFNNVSTNNVYVSDSTITNLNDNDKIIAINNKFVNNYDKLALELTIAGDKEFTMTVKDSNGIKKDLKINPVAVGKSNLIYNKDYGFEVNGLEIIKSDLEDILNERINRSFDADGYFNTQYMQTMVDKLFEQKDDERAGYYRWSAIRYFLYEYNAYLVKEKYHGQGELKWDSFKQSEKDKISIEHIFPHKAEGYWAEQFKNVDKDKWPIYEGSLGNLLLLSQKINAELQNDDFKTKKEGRESADESKKRTGYSKGSAAELEVNNEEDWTPKTIEKTGMTMLKFMEDDQWGWGIKFKSEEEKKNLLLPGIY